jgi:hypothetical protein
MKISLFLVVAICFSTIILSQKLVQVTFGNWPSTSVHNFSQTICKEFGSNVPVKKSNELDKKEHGPNEINNEGLGQWNFKGRYLGQTSIMD